MKTGIGQSKWSVFAVVFLTLILFSTGTVNSSVTITTKKAFGVAEQEHEEHWNL